MLMLILSLILILSIHLILFQLVYGVDIVYREMINNPSNTQNKLGSLTF